MARNDFMGGVLSGFLAMENNRRAWADSDRRQAAEDRLARADTEQQAVEQALADGTKPYAQKDMAGATQDAALIGPEAGGVTVVDPKETTVTPSRSQGLKRSADILREKGMGLKAAAIDEQYNKVHKEALLDALSRAAVTGDLNPALSIYNDSVPDGRKVEFGRMGDGRVALASFDEKDPAKKHFVGAYNDAYEAATALHSMVKGAPLDYLKTRMNDDLRRDMAEQNNGMRRTLAEQATAMRQAQLEARLTANGGGNGRSGSGNGSSGNGNGRAEEGSILSPKSYFEAAKFKDDDGPTAVNGYSYYTKLASSAGPAAVKSAESHGELLNMSRMAADGKVRPTMDFNPESLQWEIGLKHPDGNKFYPLSRAGVASNQNDSSTGKPFYDQATVKAKELGAAKQLATKGLLSLDGQRAYDPAVLQEKFVNDNAGYNNLWQLVTQGVDAKGNALPDAQRAEAQRLLRAVSLLRQYKPDLQKATTPAAPQDNSPNLWQRFKNTPKSDQGLVHKAVLGVPGMIERGISAGANKLLSSIDEE